MKTILEWYQELPEPYRTQAIENCDKNAEVKSMWEAISGGFFWESTEQGWKYWKELSMSYE